LDQRRFSRNTPFNWIGHFFTTPSAGNLLMDVRNFSVEMVP
jgi:hypothetical protein